MGVCRIAYFVLCGVCRVYDCRDMTILPIISVTVPTKWEKTRITHGKLSNTTSLYS